jgi:hypothetical protein
MNADAQVSRTQGAPQPCYDVPRLLQLFESLGENCDLGVVQRAVGLEPFGLFRFSACNAVAVGELLRARFDRLCEPDDLWLDVVGEEREYWVKSRNTPFEAHTNRYAGQHEEAVVRRGELDRMRYLKTHLLRDLSRGKKLFVFKGRCDLATMRNVATQLQLYASNCLLWIDLADEAHPPGSVQKDSAQLLLGYVSRFGTYDGAPCLPIDEWVSVCGNAYRLWRNEEPPQSSVENLLSRGLEWRADPGAPTAVMDVPSPAPGLVFGHRLSVPTLTPVCSTYVPLLRGGSLALSAWVNVAPTSELKRLALVFPGVESVVIWDADPRTRDRWQRLWVTATVPDDTRAIVCALMTEGEPGAQFQSAAWCLERGTRPSGYGFAL